MSTLTVTISGQAVLVIDGSLRLGERVDDKNSCTFTVRDDAGTAAYVKGQPVRVTDSEQGLLFSGFINKPTMTNLYPNPTNLWSMDCVNKFAVTAKKATTRTSSAGKRHRGGKHVNQPSGAIAALQIQEYVEPEGVTGNFGLDWSELQTDWQGGTLSGTTGATNASTGNPGAGDLELAPAGNAVTFQQVTQADFNAGTTGGGLSSPASGGITFAPTQAIKYQATNALPGLTNALVYTKIWAGSYTIVSADVLVYDLWIADSCPQQMAALDFVCSDGTTLSATTALIDAQSVGAAPSNDLSGLATNTWYNRLFVIGNSLAGKTITSASVAFAGSNQGTYTAYFRNIFIKNGATTKVTVFGPTATATQVSPPQQLQSNGYTNLSCSVVTAYERHGFMYSPFFSLTSAQIVNTSQLTWDITLPSSSFTYSITASLDGFSTFLPCTNMEAIPGLLPGMSLSGKNVILVYVFDNAGNDPTLTPLLSSIRGVINPSYAATKSDIAATTNGTTGWSGGTLTNLVNTSGNELALNGYARNWDDANAANQTLYGSASPAQGVTKKQFFLTTGSGTDVRSRLDFAGSAWQNFTMECDVSFPVGGGQTQIGLVYRTTGWQNANDTYAYMCIIQSTGAVLGHGTNTSSGAGSFTEIATASLALSSGTAYRLKLVVSGNNHQIFLNDVAIINANDSTYPAAGYVGLRFENSSGSTQTGTFDNFGIVAALSGTWVSPAIDIHALTTISNSQILLQIDPAVNGSLVMFTVEISLDNGTTWTTCPNTLTTPVVLTQAYFQALPVPGLSPGTNVSSMTQVKLRLTITASTASVGATPQGLIQAAIQAISLFVLGAYSGTGTRSTAPLWWDSATRANVASGFGTATNGGTYTQTGTGTTDLSSNELQISNTTGDVHMRAGSATQQDTMGTGRVALSAATIQAGMELRYNDAGDCYRLAISTTTVELVKVSGGLVIVLAAVPMTIALTTFYRLRFIVQGDASVGPVSLFASVWQDGTTEPTNFTIAATD